MPVITICEHGELTTAPGEQSLARATIGESDFDWVVTASARLSKWGARLVEVEGRRSLRVDNYVGVIETPSGTQIEVLPKHAGIGDDPERLRALVLRMVSAANDVIPRALDEASLRVLKHPVTEWLALQFLQRLEALVHRGIRFEYQHVEEEARYLRGQLNLPKQIVQPPERLHLFQIRHDVFTPDRPENRLLRLALDIVSKRALSSTARRLASLLLGHLHELRPSDDVERDMAAWRKTRLMAHYADIRPWCELIVSGNTPFSQRGSWRGLSMLFPMEKLFERYVAVHMRQQLALGARLTEQASSRYLCTHRGERWFMLQPDLFIEGFGDPVVLDTKWKVLNSGGASAGEKYDLSQGDFYQLYAYGNRYMDGAGEMFLIFPRSPTFQEPLPPFEFNERLRLWAVPFDLEAAQLMPGEWTRHASWWRAPATARAA